MEKKHIITIAGKPGSGKSTTSSLVAEALQFKKFSSGDFFREIAKERGIDVLEANKTAEDEKEIDHMVDQKLRELGSNHDQMVIDSRMAWHWMPYSFRVYLDLDLIVAAERIIANHKGRQDENIPTSVEAYAQLLQARLASESKRYMNLYQVNPYDPANYDLVVDTAVHNPQAVQKLILEGYENWLQ
jgi:cytidylate kinase